MPAGIRPAGLSGIFVPTNAPPKVANSTASNPAFSTLTHIYEGDMRTLGKGVCPTDRQGLAASPYGLYNTVAPAGVLAIFTGTEISAQYCFSCGSSGACCSAARVRLNAPR